MYKLAVKVIDDVNSACAGSLLHSHEIYFYCVGEGMIAIETQMNIYQNFLQTNTKAGKLFQKGL
jgi:hypothetical protein